MIKLKEVNQYRKVKIINIVSLQGDDYNTMLNDLNESWLTRGDIIDYMLQWYYNDDDHYQHNVFNAQDINTPFLGRLIKIDGYKGFFFYSHDSRIGYAGLSKIISIE